MPLFTLSSSLTRSFKVFIYFPRHAPCSTLHANIGHATPEFKAKTATVGQGPARSLQLPRCRRKCPLCRFCLQPCFKCFFFGKASFILPVLLSEPASCKSGRRIGLRFLICSKNRSKKGSLLNGNESEWLFRSRDGCGAFVRYLHIFQKLRVLQRSCVRLHVLPSPAAITTVI